MRRLNSAHLTWIRSLPCVICGDSATTEAAHIRFADPRAAKPITGMGIKPDDRWTVPLCGRHHRNQHSKGERRFWQDMGIDPIFVALALDAVSGDHEAGCQIVTARALWNGSDLST